MSIGQTSDSASVYGRDVEPWLDADNVREWLPAKAVGKDFEDVPDHIASAASEAHACASLNLFRAAGAMARAVVEATAKEKGFTAGNLVGKIDSMHSAGLIREHVKDIAHEVRHLGNDMAHGDFVEAVSQEEAEEVLALMGEVLNEVFQSPARLTKRQAARLAKKSEDGS